MSGDSNAMLEEVEEDIVSLFAVKGAEDDDDNGEIEHQGELPDTVEGLQALLLSEREVKSKRNRSLRKSKQANHRMQDELSALQRQVDSLGQPNQAPTVEAQNQEREKALEQWRDSVEEDPRKAVDFANWQSSQMQDNVVGYIAKLQETIDAKFAELTAATNPEAQKYESELNAVRTNPEFEGLSDEVLLKIIRAEKRMREPRGSIGGLRVPTQAPKKFEMNNDIRMKMGFATKGEG